MQYEEIPDDFKSEAIDFDNLTVENLLSEELYAALFSIKDSFQRTSFESKCMLVARKNKVTNEFKNNYKQYKIREVRQKKCVGGRSTNISNPPIVLNCGEWISDDYGVKKNDVNQSTGIPYIKTACTHPILPVEILRNMDTDTEKLKLAFFKNFVWNYTICDRAMAANNSKIVDLVNRGIEVSSDTAKHLVSYIADCVALNEGVIPQCKALSRMGWIDNEFMPYDEAVRFDGERENRYLYECIHKKGDFNKWVDYVRELRKNPLLRLQMAASFASPIIARVNALPFVLHFWGGPLQSGSGKTVGLMVSASIWGDPRMGALVRTMDGTQNAIMNTAGFLHSIPYLGDELQLIKDKWGNYDKLIMKVTEGVDRGRMSYDKMLPTKTWKNSFIFTGEEAIVKKDSGAGVYSRTIEVECKTMVVENGNAVVNFINENFGHAGEVFVTALKSENLLEQYNGIFKKILEECDTNEKQAMGMALILLADYLAEKHIFKTDTHLRIKDIKQYMFSKDEIDVTKRAYEWVHDWLAANQIRFNPNSDINKGEVWGKIEDEKNIAWINRNILSKHMSDMGIELSAVTSKWADRGYIERNSRGKFSHQRKVYNVSASYIKLRLNAVEDIPDNEAAEIFEQQKLT